MSPLITLLLKRVGIGAFLVFGITLITFMLVRLVPGDPAAAALGERGMENPEVLAAYRKANGLDLPAWQQYLIYVGNLLRGDMGVSQQTRRPVLTDLQTLVPATVELAIFAMAFALVIGLTLGMFAAFWHERLPDTLIRVVSLAGVSMPTFWLALTASLLFSATLGWVPSTGRLDPGMESPPVVTGLITIDSLLSGSLEVFQSAFAHILLPALVLAAYTVGLITRFTRTAVLEVLGNEYIRTAHAKGLPTRTIVFTHVLRPATVPILTVAGLSMGSLLGGAVLVENIFSWPGIGQYAYQSSLALDMPAVIGVTIFIATTYVVINLVVDLLYPLIDPRIRVS
ncbi:ABC transporter permease [Microbacterium saperdae]